MVDRVELHRLAEASLKAEETWHHEADLHGSLACTYGESGDYFVEQDAAYIAAASPDVVLGLLEEIDAQERAAVVTEEIVHKLAEERDQLRAVAVRLKEALEDVASEAPTYPDLWMKYTQDMARNVLADPEVEKL